MIVSNIFQSITHYGIYSKTKQKQKVHFPKLINTQIVAVSLIIHCSFINLHHSI